MHVEANCLPLWFPNSVANVCFATYANHSICLVSRQSIIEAQRVPSLGIFYSFVIMILVPVLRGVFFSARYCQLYEGSPASAPFLEHLGVTPRQLQMRSKYRRLFTSFILLLSFRIESYKHHSNPRPLLGKSRVLPGPTAQCG